MDGLWTNSWKVWLKENDYEFYKLMWDTEGNVYGMTCILEEKFNDCRRRLFVNIDRRCTAASDMLDLKYMWGIENENKAGAILLALRQKGLYRYFQPENSIEFYDKFGQSLK